MGVLLYFVLSVLPSFVGHIQDHRFPSGDFVVFYSAGKLALSGHAEKAYQPGALSTEITQHRPDVTGRQFLWSYPPNVFALVAPLAWLPFPWAFLIWSVGSVVLFLYAATRIHRHWFIALLLLGSPSLITVFFYGQTGFLLTALLGFGIWFLAQNRSILAGASLAGLTFKPHLALFVPLFLIADKQFTALVSMLLFSLLLMAVSLWCFGWATMLAFTHGVYAQTMPMLFSRYAFDRMASLYGSLCLWGLSGSTALIVHAVFAGFICVLSFYLCTRPFPRLLKCALLIPATVLISPYVFTYDLVALALPCVILLHLHNSMTVDRFDYAIMLLAWCILCAPEFLPRVIPFAWMTTVGLYVTVVRKMIGDKCVSLPISLSENNGV